MIEAVVAMGVLFWVFCAIAGVALLVSVGNDSAIMSVIVTVAFVAILIYGFKFDVRQYLPASKLGWTVLLACWLPIGVGWSFFKFYDVYKDRAKELHVSWVDTNSPENWKPRPNWPDNPYPTFAEYMEHYGPKVANYKNAICCWILFWPVSVTQYIIGDLISDLVNALYEQFKAVYERIARHVIDSFK